VVQEAVVVVVVAAAAASTSSVVVAKAIFPVGVDELFQKQVVEAVVHCHLAAANTW